MHAKPGLAPFYDLYAIHQGEPEFWPEALEKTEDFVKEALKERADVGAKGDGELESLHLSNLSAFLRNECCLKDFVESGHFVKEKHVPLLINLLRLGYKTAADFNASITESEGYRCVFLGDGIDILKLCGMGSNKEAGDIILENKILLYDKEE